MYKLLNKNEVAQSYAKTLAESEDSVKRRDALMVITFYMDIKSYDSDNDNDDDDNDDDDNDNDDDDNDDADNDDEESHLDALFKLIESALLHDPDAEVRMYAAWAIGCLRNTDTDVKNLMNGLNDEDYRVRIETVQSLGLLYQHDFLEAVPGLLQALADKDVTVRMHALGLLLKGDHHFVFDQINNLLDSVDADNSPVLKE